MQKPPKPVDPFARSSWNAVFSVAHTLHRGQPRCYMAIFSEAAVCKVGYSSNLPMRIAALRRLGGPVAITRVISRSGGRALERRLHRALAPYRVRGEVFRDCPEARLLFLACE
jgi:hypothetical protein